MIVEEKSLKNKALAQAMLLAIEDLLKRLKEVTDTFDIEDHDDINSAYSSCILSIKELGKAIAEY